MHLNGWQRIGIIASVIWAIGVPPVLAEEVLYCVDTLAVGISWDKAGVAAPTGFNAQRYTIKVLSDTKRTIARMTGDTAGSSKDYTCSRPLRFEPNRIVCDDDGTRVEPWIFSYNNFTRAFLNGPPTGNPADPIGRTDPNIFVAYGTCTKG